MVAILQRSYTFLRTVSGRIATATVVKALRNISTHNTKST